MTVWRRSKALNSAAKDGSFMHEKCIFSRTLPFLARFWSSGTIWPSPLGYCSVKSIGMPSLYAAVIWVRVLRITRAGACTSIIIRHD